MRKAVVLSLLLVFTNANELAIPEKVNRTNLLVAAVKMGAYVADKAIDSRWEIYKTVTGKDAPDYMQKKNAEATSTLLQESAVDLALGHSIRQTLNSFWTLTSQITPLMVAIPTAIFFLVGVLLWITKTRRPCW
jgi:hypothetical protein